MENIPRAVLKAVGEPQDKFHHLLPGGVEPSPGLDRHDCDSGCVVSGNGNESSAGRSGSDDVHGVAGRRHYSGKRSVTQEETGWARAPASAEREEQQLMASIARLDALLKDDRAPACKSHPSRRNDESAASTSSANTGDVAQTEISKSSARERKPARSGGIAQTRVRRGSGKETKTCGSARAARRSSVTAEIESAAVQPTTATPVASTSAAITDPVVFPPLVRRARVCSDETAKRGRFLSGVNGNGDNNREKAVGGVRGNCRENDRLREPLQEYDGPVSPLGVPNTDEGRGWRRRDHPEVHDYYRPRDVVRPSFAPARRAVENVQLGNGALVENDQYVDGVPVENDQYGNGACVEVDRYGKTARAPRHLNRRDEGWTEPIVCAPARYRDAIYCGERGQLMDEYKLYDGYDPRGRGGGARSDHRRIAASPQNVWDARVEGRSWEGEPREAKNIVPDWGRDGRIDYDR